MNHQDTKNRLIWLNGRIVPLGDATINVLSPTAQFGANVFEGIRCYWNESQQELYAFRLAEHFTRLMNSMKMFRMENRYDLNMLKSAIIVTIRANGYREDIAVRQTAFIDGFGTWSSRGPVGMFVAPVPKERRRLETSSAIRCCISSWCRISDRNISPRVKAGANYINSRMGQLEAIEHGYDSAIFLNDQGKVSEGPGSCLFIVRNGKLITPPTTASVLESITRMTIIELAEKVLHIETIVRDIDRTELYISDEAFFCGSAVEVTPIGNIDGYQVGAGITGKITFAIHDIYTKTVTGCLSEYFQWLTPIYDNRKMG